MAATYPAPQTGLTLTLPRQAENCASAIETQSGARARGWAGACRGAWIASHAGAVIAGGLTTGGWHTLGYVPDALIGALMTLALFSGLTALVRLAIWAAGWAAGRLGTIAARRVGPRALAPARFLRALPGRAIAALLVTLAMVFEYLVPLAPFQMLRLAYPGELLWLVLLPAGMLAGAALSGNAGFGRFLPPGRAALGMMAVAVVLPIALGGWFLYPGTDAYLPPASAANVDGRPAFDFANSALAGSYAVETLTYGSGNDRHRPEYGAEVTLHTEAVDGSQVFMGFTGFEGGFFRWYWGFGMSSLPLQGRVWLPEGDGPFPLVLIVHGNHMAGDFSDGGYAYLGEHLASRGFIAVSVDENFLNGFNLYDAKGQEMAARAWLLLEHLDQFKTWNEIAGNPFYGRVDLSRVALIGHSRGGEAVAHAAALNRRVVSPVSNVAGPGDYGYGIQAVIAMAPCDGQ